MVIVTTGRTYQNTVKSFAETHARRPMEKKVVKENFCRKMRPN
jgi:hypothetical protein